MSGIIVGFNYGTIENSSTSGTVSGNTHVGGITGYNHDYATINNSHSTTSVSGTNYIGGLIGVNTGDVENSYFTGSVSGTYSGGISGYMYTRNSITSTISNSYSQVQFQEIMK